MADVGSDEGFVQNERGILEACIDVAVGPFVGRLAHGQAALFVFGEVCSVHLTSVTAGAAALRRLAGRAQTFPSVRGFGPPGRRVSSGSMTKGSGSKSISIFSMASAAVSSSTAATARIGSPCRAAPS